MLKDGMTYMHEHTTIDLSEVKNNEDCKLDVFPETVREFKSLYEKGVRNIVDVTNIGMGRNITYVQKVAEETGINIVFSTGFYQDSFYPIHVFREPKEKLAEKMIMEIVEGIKGTDAKAEIIGEIGTSYNKWTETERKVFEAVVVAHKQTKKPITTHTSIGTLGHEQVEFFKKHEVELNRVVIGHVDLSGDADYILKMLREGVYVEFDTIGKENYMPDRVRAEILKKIQDKGYIDKVLLSMDITRKSHLVYKGGVGYSYLIDTFIPLLQTYGITDESIDKMLIKNPRAFMKGESE
ncbi:phosphotriesterase family protein [Bacillus paralicheniformis]|uniref:phosphotriesterase family protein n=1 Tax=Bacillus paralicheniformis TaxID=1648923 RepID=UPI002244DFE2|nr:TatD family hydrolase [Bacillus paralicheniformis]MEC1023219.1 TatD family hydrolase [Bacillus paralicheniformis]MEC1025785.1 TatD family hydrolase [Bacillus paralicheniformis]MEC1035799.1 TatD family hydrolase [Bacillus paralicheniformis]MEC1050063.1 TatD family hydrolase [Bacillus paralicheniformis]MEC1060321.1 TatD family hydrolase [Bacillus paralicheniformis]